MARGGADEGTEAAPTATASKEEDEAAALARQAARLREEAAAQAAVLEAQKRLREEREKMQAPPEEDAAKELERVTDKLALIRPKLRKAEAFSLPEKDTLKSEVSDLESRVAELKKKLEPPPAPAPPPPPAASPVSSEADKKLGGLTRDGKTMSQWTDDDWEAFATLFEDSDVERRFDLIQTMGPEGKKRLQGIVVARDAKKQAEEDKKTAARVEENRKAAEELRGKLTFENVQRMSNEERFELANKLGPSYLTSLALIAFSFWAIGLPILAYFYHESTGQWPSVFSLFSLDDVAATGGMMATILGVYALLKPVRLVAAIFLTPWTMENITPYLPWTGIEEQAEQDQGGKKDGPGGGAGKK